MIDLGMVRPGSTIRIPFNTFDSNDPQASATVTAFVAADIEVYKDGSATQRASDSGYTVTVDFDTTTGNQLVAIDLSDNTTAGFWEAGSEYLVSAGPFTLDAATVNAWIGRFTIGYADAILNTSIATLASQTSFTLNTGPAEDDALNGMWCIIHDVASAVQMGYGIITDYVGSTRTVTLAAGTTFTAAATDNISIMGPMPIQPTVTGRTLDVTATGAAGIDWGNVENQSTAVDLSGTDIQLVNTVTILTGHTPQTGDSFARLGAPAGASVSADIAQIEAQTDDIGVAGAGLTAVPYNAAWDAEIQSEVNDALVAFFTSSAQLVDDIWDEVLTAATHNVAASAGRRLRNVSGIITTDSAVNDPGAAATTTVFNTDLTEADNFWEDHLIIFTSGALTGQAKPIQAYSNTNGQITLDEPLTAAPADNDEFVIQSTHIHPVSQIADTVWDEAQADHTTAGSFGEIATEIAQIITDIAALNNISTAQVNAEVLDVLNTDTFAELGAVPAATSTLVDKLTWLFMLARNQVEQTATTQTVRADDTTTSVATSAVSDDGTTFTRGEMT